MWYTATMETPYATTEEAEFKNPDNTRKQNFTYNHAAADATVTSPDKSAMLNTYSDQSGRNPQNGWAGQRAEGLSGRCGREVWAK